MPDIYKSAQKPIRKTESGKYGENDEHAQSLEQKAKEQIQGTHYFAPAKQKQDFIDKKLKEMGG